MKTSNKVFLLPSIILLLAIVVKIFDFPNHLLFVVGALSLILILLIVFLIFEIRKQKSSQEKIPHPIFCLFSFLIILLPYIGMFQQKPLPNLIYAGMVIAVIFYFKKINSNRYSFVSFISPYNYRNFVLQNLLLVILNSPFIDIIPDKFYSPSFTPKYEQSKGPELFIDEAHNNYHTLSGLYTTFSNILKKDGYNVKPFSKKFSDKSLKSTKLLVISNALNIKNLDNWEYSVNKAFDENEIKCIKDWVSNGGSLFLIADHPPFSIASEDLAKAFGFKFADGIARKKQKSGDDLFCRKNNMLLENEITNGNKPKEFVDSIITYTGQAFQIPDSAKSILTFNLSYAEFLTLKGESDPVKDILGLSQGAYMKFGKGKLVVFGEAAMFSGQFGAGLSWAKVGLNSPKAKNNYKLLLNIVHWLDNK
jgi:hypothetical protein